MILTQKLFLASSVVVMILNQGCGSKHKAPANNGASADAAMMTAGSPTQNATQLLTSGTIDWTADTVTLPLHQGTTADGKTLWYVLTDTDDAQKASDLGLVYASALSNVKGIASTRTAVSGADGNLVFNAGGIDFSPKRQIVPGAAPSYFPPTTATPGSVGDSKYSPFVVVDGIVFNAPVVAYGVDASQIDFCNGSPDYDLVHDKVLKICPDTKTVTLPLTHGFAGGKEVVYLSFDSNVGLPATLEASTLAAAEDDLKNSGATLSLYAVVNGVTGANSADRQGLDSALAGEGSPLNILSGLPSPTAGYSPLWDIHMTVWSDAAVQSGARHRLTSATAVLQAASAGLVTGPAGAQLGSAGLLVNCPVVAVIQ